MCGYDKKFENDFLKIFQDTVKDSTGKTITIGSLVRFRGRSYTIEGFGEMLDHGAIEIKLVGDIHTTETPDEFSVDLIK